MASLRRAAGRSAAAVLLVTVGLLVSLAVFSRGFYRLVRLDEVAYRSFSITAAALGKPKLVVRLLAPVVVVV